MTLKIKTPFGADCRGTGASCDINEGGSLCTIVED